MSINVLCHLDSVHAESLAASAKLTGGTKSALQNQVTVKRMDLISVLKCLYSLAKQEIAHHTKYKFISQSSEENIEAQLTVVLQYHLLLCELI